MSDVRQFELHYYFNDTTHTIDALLRNKCEAELLQLVLEAASLLEIDAHLLKEAYKEGGFRDIWKAAGNHAAQLTLLLLIVQLILTAIPLFDSENKQLELEERKLGVEEKKLNIEKLKKELGAESSPKALKEAASAISSNLKIVRRKSNFYSHLNDYSKVSQIGISIADGNWKPITEEATVLRSAFRKHILTSNRLKSEEDSDALIELISPVLKEGRYRWKGMYNDMPISFEMQDTEFRDAVLLENIPFQHGSKIVCVLVIHRELDEIGDVKIIGYSVPTVLEKIDGDSPVETPQGRRYRHGKKLAESQADMFHSANDGKSNKRKPKV